MYGLRMRGLQEFDLRNRLWILGQQGLLVLTAPRKLMGVQQSSACHQEEKPGRGEPFCKYVCTLVMSGNVANGKIFMQHLLPNEMVVHFNMFGSGMIDGV
jgi:hypothetical protein